VKASSPKTITIVLISHESGREFRRPFRVAHVKLIFILLFISVAIGAGILIDYVTLLPARKIHHDLRAENSELRGQFQNASGKLSSIQSELKKMKTYADKLRFITTINDPERGLKLSMQKKSSSNSNLQTSITDSERTIASAPNDDIQIPGPFFKEKTLKELAGRDLHRGTQNSYNQLIRYIETAIKESESREKEFIELWELLQDRSELLASTPSTKPARGNYSSRFGYRLSPYGAKPMMHEGLDIAASPGTPVFAPADGIVKVAGLEGGYGKLVVIDHGYGVETRYGHNSRLYVHVGQKVKRGEMLSAVGNTGRSTGPHVHYEVRVNGEPVDPINYILEE
jgi:murein DD-endopeptidase MepM/ murein hydrolase activator NlpD